MLVATSSRWRLEMGCGGRLLPLQRGAEARDGYGPTLSIVPLKKSDVHCAIVMLPVLVSAV
jgi:hypothetical protein